ncbi:MAG TPA: hypothetical protein VJ279_08545 [Hanamia sp.]|jgi:hypothetical protein|nr:hypothetical protein [Hanamia sp.]
MKIEKKPEENEKEFPELSEQEEWAQQDYARRYREWQSENRRAF